MKFTLLLIVVTSYFLPTQSQNLVDSDSWTVGSGPVGNFYLNGTASENIREIGVGPHGEQAILWKAVPDGDAQADGGWEVEWFEIDQSAMYRFSVWIKKTNSHEGSTFFGCYSNDILTLSGTVNTNPYFWAGDLPELDKWYLLVGYVHASDDPSTSSYGGIYDGVTGAKVVSITDYKFSSSATIARHRTYLYYDPNTADRQYFYGPEVYQVESGQPVNDVVASTSFNANVFFGDKIGVGVFNPLGDVHIHSPSTELVLTSEEYAAIRGNGQTWLLGYSGEAGSEEISMGTQDGSGSRSLTLAAGGSARVKILPNGNVGIGTVNPNERLTVNGIIYGKEVRVDLSVPGPDYVFEADYDLPTLEEIENYISWNKHLPETPSAKEMQANGINVSEFNMLLLKKIEELTLHLIKLNKENRAMKTDIELLKQKQ